MYHHIESFTVYRFPDLKCCSSFTRNWLKSGALIFAMALSSLNFSVCGPQKFGHPCLRLIIHNVNYSRHEVGYFIDILQCFLCSPTPSLSFLTSQHTDNFWYTWNVLKLSGNGNLNRPTYLIRMYVNLSLSLSVIKPLPHCEITLKFFLDCDWKAVNRRLTDGDICFAGERLLNMTEHDISFHYLTTIHGHVTKTTT